LASPLVRELLEAGIHFGHHCSRWNPKMKPYIYGKRNSIHIIDIRETLRGLLYAQQFITRVVAGGADILFVGTKRQARETIIEQSTGCGMHYVTERWLGGALTNFRTIRSRLKRLEELEELKAGPKWNTDYSKKMQSTLSRELRKIQRNLNGIRNMTRMPGALFIVDVRKEINALREARTLGIPTVCLIDTDSDPDFASIPIPGNDDSMRSIQLVASKIAEAVEEGKRARPAPVEKPHREKGASADDTRRRTRREPSRPASDATEAAAQVAVAEPVAPPTTQTPAEPASSNMEITQPSAEDAPPNSDV